MKPWKHIQFKLTEYVERLLPEQEPKPWERYRQRVKEVLWIAIAEAKYDEVTPTTGYLLLGLLRGEDADSQTFLKQMGVDTEALLDYVEAHVVEIQEPPAHDQPWLSSDGHRVLWLAKQEARSLGFAKVNTLHFLLGLVLAEETWSAQLLAQYKVDPRDIRDYILQIYGPMLLQASDSPEEATTLLRSPVRPEPESQDLLRSIPEEI